MKKEIRLFIEKLKAERASLAQNGKYMKEHNFLREEEYIMTKIYTLNETLNQLELLIEGKITIEEVEFNF